MRTLAPSSSFQAGSGTSSGPEGAWGHLPLLLLLEFLVGLIQVCKHLQQAGSCLSLLSWGIGTGPWEKEKGTTRGLSQARAGCCNSDPMVFSGSRYAWCPKNPKMYQSHTHSPLACWWTRNRRVGGGDRDGVLGQVCEVSERAKKRDLLIPYLPWHCRSLSLCLPLELDPRWNPPGMSSWKLRGKNPDCTLSANVAL